MITFDRVAELQVGTLVVSGLRFAFNVERTLRATPGKAEIKVYNMTEAHRGEVESLDTVPVTLSAGYAEGTHVIFKGDLKNAKSRIETPNWITTLDGVDGSRRQSARTRRSFRSGTSLTAVVQALAGDLGLGVGNVAETIAAATLAGASTTFATGTALDGNAWATLVALCASAELELSIQNETLQVLPLRQALTGTALVLSQDSGLVGSPTKEKGGRIKFQAQMIPDLFPGRLVEMRSRNIVGGQYRVTKCAYKGDSEAQDWGIDAEAEPIERARR